jgi:putative transcription factor
MICEMCGKEVDLLNRVRIEGTTLGLCAECSRFGEVVAPEGRPSGGGAPAPSGPAGAIDERLRVRARRMVERDLFQELPELELLPDWPKRVRQAREKLGWTPEEFGKRLNEKKSLVLKLESGSFHPPDATVRKLEHLLKVRLRANPGEVG